MRYPTNSAIRTILLATGVCLSMSEGLALPEITQQPRDAVLVEMQTPGFSVRAVGNGTLSYQWYCNGVAIPEATDYKYFPEAVSLLDNGTRYTVEVTDTSGSVISEAGRIRISTYTSDVEMPRPSVESATYHLDSVNGNDSSGDGSAAAPYRTFSRIQSLLSGGEVVVFHAGSYGDISFNENNDPHNDWVALMPAPRETVTLGRVRIIGSQDGDTLLHNGHYDAWVRLIGFDVTNEIQVSNANLVRIEQCHVTLPGSFNDTEANIERTAISVRNARSVTIEDCDITQTAHGVAFRANDITLRRTSIHDIAHDAVRVTGCDIVRIENCVINNTDDGTADWETSFPRHSDGIHIFREQTGIPDPIEANMNLFIRGNRIFHHEVMAIMAQHEGSVNWVIENNIFGPSGGFMLHLKLPVRGCVFRHNTMAYVANESYVGMYRTIETDGYAIALPTYGTSTDMDIYNNIIVGPKFGNEFGINNLFRDRYDHNLFYERVGTSGSLGDDAIVEAESPLLDPGSYDGRLVPTTAAIGGGSPLEPIAVDIYGTPRPSPPTIGAVEPVDTEETVSPSTPGNLSATANADSVELSWDASTDNQLVAGYVLYRDGIELATTHRNFFRDRALKEQTPYTYSVSAFDPAGNYSGLSAPISITTEKAFMNCAVDRPVAASSESSAAPASSAVDGALLTAWTPEGEGSHILEVDLQTEYRIEAFEVVSGIVDGLPIGAFTIELLQGSDWVVLPGTAISGNAEPYAMVRLPEIVTTDRIRLLSDSSGIELNEIRVSGDPVDVQAPDAPGAFQYESEYNEVWLSWNASADNVATHGYILYRDSQKIATLSETEYRDTRLAPDSNYSYEVMAYDAAGNISNPGASLVARTQTVPEWGGFLLVDYTLPYVNTGDWLGWLDIERAPWLWCESIQGWMYAPDPGDVREAWVYFPNYAPTPLVEGDAGWGGFPVDADGFVNTGDWLGYFYDKGNGWLWSYSLDKWVFAPDPGADPSGVWMFVQQPYWTGSNLAWSSVDLGNIIIPGTFSCDAGTITMTGDGSDVWAKQDHGHFIYRQITGDFDISVRVRSVQSVSGWTKTGLMVRNSLEANAANAYMMFAPNGSHFQVRTTVSGDTGWGYFVENQDVPSEAPVYLRLQRVGNSFTGYFSQDGVQWTERSHQGILMPETLYFGLMLSSHSSGSAASAVLDRLSISIQ